MEWQFGPLNIKRFCSADDDGARVDGRRRDEGKGEDRAPSVGWPVGWSVAFVTA